MFQYVLPCGCAHWGEEALVSLKYQVNGLILKDNIFLSENRISKRFLTIVNVNPPLRLCLCGKVCYFLPCQIRKRRKLMNEDW